jgi:hypothetical protein
VNEIGIGRHITAMYLLIALAALPVGILINMASGQTVSENEDPVLSFIFLLAIYVPLHLPVIACAALIAIFLRPRPRSIVYFVISIVAFVLAASALASPWKDGVHLFVIFAGSLILIAGYYLWLVHTRVPGDS